MGQQELFPGESALPSGLVYLPDFLSQAEERDLLHGIGGLDLREKIGAWLGMDPEAFGYALVAEYRPGTQLGWHRDVPHFEVVAGVSLASTATMRWRRFPPTKNAPVCSLDLPPRSAYVLRGDARWKWQHSIAATPALRYSITFRTRAAQ